MKSERSDPSKGLDGEIAEIDSSGICFICGNIATKILAYEAHGSRVNETYCDSCFKKMKSLQN